MKTEFSKDLDMTTHVAIMLSFVLAFAACQQSPPAIEEPEAAVSLDLPPGVETATEAINEETLKAHTASLSSDEFEGRAPASPGDEKARQYLQDTMASLGLEPGAQDGAWQQRFAIMSITSEAPEVWSFEGQDGSLDLASWDDFIAGSGVQSEKALIDDAELVFVGYGIEAPEYDWDDIKGADLEGKVLLMMNNDPDWDPELFEGDRRLYYGRWTYKYEVAARHGAAGAIIIHTTPSAGYPWQVVQASWTGAQFELPAGDEPRSQVSAWITEEAARSLVAVSGHELDALRESARSRDFQPVPLGITTSLLLTNSIDSVETGNVAGLLEGSDPILKNEVVVYSAHHDHFGIGEPNDEGDNIYNGALDNAAGCGKVLTIADAFTRLPEPPRRSVLFLFVAGEEQGLIGSEYYAKNPTFPPGRIAANVNIDGANIFGRTSDVAYIGFGKSTLDDVVVAAAARQGRTVVGDQFPDRGSFYRSDQFNFSKIGVPAIYADSGTTYIGRPDGWGKEQAEAWESVHYHQPSDEMTDDWNFEGIIEDTVLAFEAGLSIAQTAELPSWTPGDEFEAARIQALAELD
ncbi:MAG: M28 family peptidase [Thermoanaerobaculia bacterium]|jgi:Zn-dependent M28 family amino/carboxypeptidase